jgi:hypothetical protein
MLSKQVIMREWRQLARRIDDMTLMYTESTAPIVVPVNSPVSPRLPPGSPARAPASLSG